MKRAGLLAAVLASLALAAPATAGVGKFIHGVADENGDPVIGLDGQPCGRT